MGPILVGGGWEWRWKNGNEKYSKRKSDKMSCLNEYKE